MLMKVKRAERVSALFSQKRRELSRIICTKVVAPVKPPMAFAASNYPLAHCGIILCGWRAEHGAPTTTNRP